jgi:Glutathione peroxidase
VAPTGRKVMVPHVVVMGFDETGRVAYDYWDQATLLVQLGLLDPALLPVRRTGRAPAGLARRRSALGRHGIPATAGIAFHPCNQFGHQEPGDAVEIASFCKLTYDVTFPLFSKIDVDGSTPTLCSSGSKRRRRGSSAANRSSGMSRCSWSTARAAW